MAFLFDTDAVSEALKRRPQPAYVEWLATVPRDEQYASAVTIGEMYRGAFRTHDGRHLVNIEERVLTTITVLPYDTAVARVYGDLHAQLAASNSLIADADLQIAATAVNHGLTLVTANLKHFARVPGLVVERILAARRTRPDRLR
jgi:predicted nucleic acid-binding protein